MIETWCSGDAELGMSEQILLDLLSLSETVSKHPWYKARASLALTLLRSSGVRPPARVLDAGCGWGFNLDALEAAGYRVVGLDVSRRTLEQLDRPSRTLVEADLTQPLPDSVEPFDAVLALDVIEHLDDDRAAVARLARLTRPGGTTLVSVPALPELYSEFDSVQGHRRRYTREVLRGVLEGVGLEVERVLWWGTLMLPMVRRQRSQSKALEGDSTVDTYRRYMTLPPWPAPVLMRAVFAVDTALTVRELSRKGTSLFAVCRRR